MTSAYINGWLNWGAENLPWFFPSTPSQGLQSAKKLLKFLEMVPENLKSGPWSPVAHLVIISYAGFLLLTFNHAMDVYQQPDYTSSDIEWVHPWLQMYRLFGGLYCLGTVMSTIVAVGYWPFTSYTLTSWNFMTLRLIFAFLAGCGFSSFAPLADLMRFPALVGCTVTVHIWWLALVPLISYLLRDDQSGLEFFWRWNLSCPLLNVHLLNLPLVGAEFILSAQPLTFFDLWTGFVVALLYVLFYLNVLDARGLHFYIIFTPRTKWCFVPYCALIFMYYWFFLMWNLGLFISLEVERPLLAVLPSFLLKVLGARDDPIPMIEDLAPIAVH